MRIASTAWKTVDANVVSTLHGSTTGDRDGDGVGETGALSGSLALRNALRFGDDALAVMPPCDDDNNNDVDDDDDEVEDEEDDDDADAPATVGGADVINAHEAKKPSGGVIEVSARNACEGAMPKATGDGRGGASGGDIDSGGTSLGDSLRKRATSCAASPTLSSRSSPAPMMSSSASLSLLLALASLSLLRRAASRDVFSTSSAAAMNVPARPMPALQCTTTGDALRTVDAGDVGLLLFEFELELLLLLLLQLLFDMAAPAVVAEKDDESDENDDEEHDDNDDADDSRSSDIASSLTSLAVD